MKLSNNELKNYFFGAYRFKETEDGYLHPLQYSAAQEDYFKEVSDFWHVRCDASSAKTIELITTATEISFDYKIIWVGSPDTFELAVDGLISQIYYLKDIEDEGRLTFTLPEGKKNVIIYLPADGTAVIRNFEINASADVPDKNAKVLWLGDSITQGYGPFRAGHIYVSVANRLLNYDVINQGIGGYVYDKNSIMKMDGYTPDKIIISLGTNQFRTEEMTDIEEFYKRLMDVYGNDIPVLCITPIWRGDSLEDFPVLLDFRAKLTDICKRYKNVQIVDGFKLVPHLPEYYLDNLHPNAFGMEMYGRNLVLEIQKLGF